MGGVAQFLAGLYFVVFLPASFVFWVGLTSPHEAPVWRRIRAVGMGAVWPYTIGTYSRRKQALREWESQQLER